MVRAWATESHLVLAQKKVDEKSNEITAIPDLLRLLEVSGCIVKVESTYCRTVNKDLGRKVLAV